MHEHGQAGVTLLVNVSDLTVADHTGSRAASRRVEDPAVALGTASAFHERSLGHLQRKQRLGETTSVRYEVGWNVCAAVSNSARPAVSHVASGAETYNANPLVSVAMPRFSTWTVPPSPSQVNSQSAASQSR